MREPLGLPEVGEIVQVHTGLPKADGMPLAVVRSVGTVNARVQLYYNATEHYVPLDGIRRFHEDRRPPTVIVGCGSAKLGRPAAAGAMYVGSYHRAARRAAAALTDDAHTLILSARYGLLRLDDPIEPYELRIGDPQAISSPALRDQAESLRLLVLDRCIVLAGGCYVEVCKPVWPYLEHPLAGTQGIGEQMSKLAALARTARGVVTVTRSHRATFDQPAGTDTNPYGEGFA